MRINLFGGPGSGKSTLASQIFVELKKKGYEVKQANEYVKDWAFQNITPDSFDQVYLFAKQMRQEDLGCRNKDIDFVITDCPLLMVASYTKHYGYTYGPELIRLAQVFEEEYPSINFFLQRTYEYVPKGRYQKEEDLVKIDSLLMEDMRQHSPHMHTIFPNDFVPMMQIIFDKGPDK